MDMELQQRSVVGCQLVADVARRFGEVCLKVTGASMMPAIWPGDIITVRRCNIAELRLGQIVLSRRDEKLFAHRITSICGNLVTTRGDSLEYNDPAITVPDIIGQVIHLVRNGRRVHLRQSWWQNISSFILRRSDFCTRMTLRLGRRLRRLGSREMSWVS
jgi:signal peptidase